MCPIYDHVCEKCGKTASIVGKFEDSDRSPTNDEVEVHKDDTEEQKVCDHCFRKVIGKNIRVRHPAGYGSKGNWNRVR